MDLKIVPTEEIIRDDISLKSLKDKPKVKVNYEVEKKEVSKNIQKFDKKPRVFTENPFAYNSVSLKKNKPDVTPIQSASELLTNPIYNKMGKFLGVDTIHDWNRYYDKVYAITEWAKLKSGEKDLSRIMKWVSDQSRRTPNMGAREIDSLYLHARLFLTK
jgi:hypothetical protein